jgi:hypothetical protein
MLTGYLDPSKTMRILVSDRPNPTTFAVVLLLRGIRSLPSWLNRTRSPTRKYSCSADIIVAQNLLLQMFQLWLGGKRAPVNQVTFGEFSAVNHSFQALVATTIPADLLCGDRSRFHGVCR